MHFIRAHELSRSMPQETEGTSITQISQAGITHLDILRLGIAYRYVSKVM